MVYFLAFFRVLQSMVLESKHHREHIPERDFAVTNEHLPVVGTEASMVCTKSTRSTLGVKIL